MHFHGQFLFKKLPLADKKYFVEPWSHGARCVTCGHSFALYWSGAECYTLLMHWPPHFTPLQQPNAPEFTTMHRTESRFGASSQWVANCCTWLPLHLNPVMEFVFWFWMVWVILACNFPLWLLLYEKDLTYFADVVTRGCWPLLHCSATLCNLAAVSRHDSINQGFTHLFGCLVLKVSLLLLPGS